MASAKLVASEIAGILILECLMRLAKDHSSALILAALCLLSFSIDTLAERIGAKPMMFGKMDFVHLFYSVAMVFCACVEFLKISGKGMGHFEEVPFYVAIAIHVLVLLEILYLLIKQLVSARGAARPNIMIDNNNINRGAATLTWTAEAVGAANGASLSTLTLTTTTGLKMTLTAYRINLTVSQRSAGLIVHTE